LEILDHILHIMGEESDQVEGCQDQGGVVVLYGEGTNEQVIMNRLGPAVVPKAGKEYGLVE
jgi:hypothetical protein